MHQHNSTRPSRLGARLAGGIAATAIALAGLALAPAAQAAPVAEWPSTLSVGQHPRGLAIHDSTLYVASRQDAIWAKPIDGTARKVVSTPLSFAAVAVEPDGDLLYTQDGSGSIFRVPAATVAAGQAVQAGEAVMQVPGTTYINSLASGPSGALYAAVQYSGQVYLVTESGASPLLQSPRSISAVSVAGNGDLYVIVTDSGKLSRVAASALADGVITDAEIEPVPEVAVAGSNFGLAWVDGQRFYRTPQAWSGSIQLTAAVTPSVATGTPLITGDRTVGETLAAEPGAGWTSGTTFAYRWLRDGVAIDGATASSYVLTAADRGTAITVELTGSLQGHRSASAVSASAGTVFTGTLTPGTPSVTGDLVVGATVTGTTGTWAEGVALSFQWLREKTPIEGATGSSYVLTPADEGFTIALAVTGSLAGYNDETARIRTSAPVAAAPVVTPPVVTPPVVTPPVVTPPVVVPPAVPAPAVTIGGVAEVDGRIAGSTITVRGDGLGANSAWSVWLRSTPVLLASGFADASGAFERTVALPATIEPGAHRLIVSGVGADGSPVESVVYVTVRSDGTLAYRSTVQPEPATAAAPLPPTGVDAGGVPLALALLVAGALLVVVRRRTAH